MTDQAPYIAAVLILLAYIYYRWSRPRELSETQEFQQTARENAEREKRMGIR